MGCVLSYGDAPQGIYDLVILGLTELASRSSSMGKAWLQTKRTSVRAWLSFPVIRPPLSITLSREVLVHRSSTLSDQFPVSFLSVCSLHSGDYCEDLEWVEHKYCRKVLYPSGLSSNLADLCRAGLHFSLPSYLTFDLKMVRLWLVHFVSHDQC